MDNTSLMDTLVTSLDSPEIKQGEKAKFWRFLERKNWTVYFEVFAWSGEKYVMEFNCDGYISEPILGRFVQPDSYQCTSNAWPCGNKTFGNWFKWQEQNLFICWPADRGGIKHHPDWGAQKYWNKTNNPLHQYLEFIRQCLNIRANGYQPKSQSNLVA